MKNALPKIIYKNLLFKTKKIVFMYFFTLLSILAFGGFLCRHDYHIAIADMNWNDTDKAWQVVLKVFADDLEEALAKQEGKKVSIEHTKNAENQALKKYIAQHFLFEKNKNPLLLGAELHNDMCWIYVEYPTKSPFKIKNFINNVFFELFNDQMNMLNVKYKDKKKTFLYQKGKEMQEISF